MSFEQPPAESDVARHAIDALRQKMSAIEPEREAHKAAGMSDGEAGRMAAIRALTAVSEFCLHHSIESRPLNRLIVDLGNVTLGRRASDLVKPARGRGGGRPSDGLMVEEVKGGLAAIVAYRQARGETRGQATRWVARNLTPTMRKVLRSPSPATISDWLLTWGGNHAEEGRGRTGYLNVRERLSQGADDQTMLTLIRGLDRYLLPSE